MHALLEARNLSCGYQGQQIFDGIDFKLHPGQFSGLVGPSGSGKTTLIKSLMGLVQPWQGQICYRGQPVPTGANLFGGRSRRPRIGYVPQVETVDWSFPVTAAEVVMMGRYRPRNFWPLPSRRDRAIATHLLARVGAAEIAHQAIGDLSGGQQQRVFLARALVGDPELLLLDEPTSSADIQTQHELLHLLWDLNDQGVSILLSTHDLNSVATHLPWVVCFNHGIIVEGKPLDVLTSETLSQTFGGDMVVQQQGNHVLIASRATAIAHPVQRPRPTLLNSGNADLESSHANHPHGR
ncbi:MAG: metal ABC transporter ATP-binding protein [Phormidesmis sp.]